MLTGREHPSSSSPSKKEREKRNKQLHVYVCRDLHPMGLCVLTQQTEGSVELHKEKCISRPVETVSALPTATDPWPLCVSGRSGGGGCLLLVAHAAPIQTLCTAYTTCIWRTSENYGHVHGCVTLTIEKEESKPHLLRAGPTVSPTKH